MSAVIERIKAEPAIVATAVGAVLSLLVAFGLPISDEQTAAVLAVVWAGLGFFVRSRVTPVKKR